VADRLSKHHRRQKSHVDRKLGFLENLPALSPAHWSFDAPHIRAISAELDRVTSGEIDRLAVFLPPRHGKSMTVTIRYPVYRLLRDPSLRVLITGYNERFARKFGRQTRNLAMGRITLAEDKAGADEWETAAGGGVMARGVGSPPTGSGYDLVVIDDPIRKREDADSEVFREKVWDWYTDDLYTRQEPGCAIILVLTRWHHDDVAARALASEPGRWTVLRLPALAEEGDALGRQPGEALWPARYDERALASIRSVMSQNEGLASWESLYQQNPTPREGAFFKVNQLQFIDPGEVPAIVRSCRGWDLAASPGRGDFTAGVKLGKDAAGVFYVLDVARGQWSTDDRNARMLQTAARDGKTCAIRLAQDPGQAGVDQAQSLVRMLAGYNVSYERVSGSKETRADPFSAQVNAGNVRVVRGAWNSMFIEELRQFPAGKHDDQVDGGSDSFKVLVGSGEFRQRDIRDISR
jgi:predicted phage terminase large subunit-like protein